MGIKDGAAAGQVRKSVNRPKGAAPREVRQGRACRSIFQRVRLQGWHDRRWHDPGVLARSSCYEERALLPRHSFAEMKRMHGQKPLWSPGAWQEYLCTAWLLARCPQVHNSRACAGETTAARPRVLVARFLLVTVPLPLSTLSIALPPHGFRSS